MLPPPARRATHADVAHQSLALPPGYALAVASLRSFCRTPPGPLRSEEPLAPRRTSPLPLRERPSSRRQTATRAPLDHDRTPQQSGRSQSVGKSTFATSQTLPFARASSLYTAT